MLDHISQVLVALANGLIAGAGALVSLRSLLVLSTLACLLWLAAVETMVVSVTSVPVPLSPVHQPAKT